MEIGKAYVDAFIRQSEFIATLSISTIGGLVLLIMWVVTQAPRAEYNLKFYRLSLLLWSAILEAMAIVCYYFTVGYFINAIPKILPLPKSDGAFFGAFPDGYDAIMRVACAEAFFFGLGIVLIFVFGWLNRDLLFRSRR